MSKHHVESSKGYFWNTKDGLGTGATAQVFAGYSRDTGEKVAIKVFSGRSYNYDYLNRQREIDVIKALTSHENIVSLLSVEEQKTSKQTIIVMELCTGGNLYEVIDAPENAYGLGEQEFLRVMINVANGMQFLHQKNIVHRDIKPGNIMRSQKPDGSYSFKLTDFGASRELQQDETFQSYYGTEEYLHPDMYERALVNPHTRKAFSAKVDLWSVGATFYQAATGRLPFQSYLRRADKIKMFEIISQKPPGMISGWQRVENGQIEYSNRLPEDARISLGLKRMVTPILAGLLENNIDKMMDFKEFFSRIDRISNMKVIDVFVISQSWYYKVYIDPEVRDRGLDVLIDSLTQQTGIPQSQMELFFDNHPFKPPSYQVKDLPITTEDRPMFLYGGPSWESKHLSTPPMPDVDKPPAKNSSLDNDAVYAKTCTQVAYQYKYGAERLERIYRLMHLAASGMSHAVEQQVKDVDACSQSTKKTHKDLCGQLIDQARSLRDLLDLLKSLDVSLQGAITQSQLVAEVEAEVAYRENPLRGMIGELTDPVKKVSHYCEEINNLKTWDATFTSKIFTKSVETMTSHMRSVKEVFTSFMKDRRMRSMLQCHNSKLYQVLTDMSDFDKQVHHFAKGRVGHQLHVAGSKLKDLIKARGELSDRLHHWLRQLVPVRNDLCLLLKYFQNQQLKYENHINSSEEWKIGQSHRMQRIADTLGTMVGSRPTEQTPGTPAGMPQYLPAEVDECLRELHKITQENISKAEVCTTELDKYSTVIQ